MIGTAAFILFLAGITAIVVLSLAGKVNVALMLFVPLLPLHNILYRFHAYPLGKDFIDIAILAMLLGWLLHSVCRGEKMLAPSPLNTAVLLLVVFTFFSLWQGAFHLGGPLPFSTQDERLQTWKNYMLLPVLYFVTLNNVRTALQVKHVLLFMFLSMLVVDYYTGRQIHFMGSAASRDRLVGTFVWLGPNQVAAYYVQCIMVMIGIYSMHKTERFFRLLVGAIIIPAFIITLFLYSRGAYIALFLGLLTIGVMEKRKLIIPLVLLVVAWQTVLPQTVIDRIKETRSADGALDSSSQKRLDMWKEAWDMFASNPVTGVGFDVIHTTGLKAGFRDTHNIYIKVLAEQGLVGFFLFMLLLYQSLKSGVRLFRNSADTLLQGVGLGYTACVVAMIAMNIFGDRWTYLQVGAYFWVFMGLVCRGLLLAEDEQEEDEQDEDVLAYGMND